MKDKWLPLGGWTVSRQPFEPIKFFATLKDPFGILETSRLLLADLIANGPLKLLVMEDTWQPLGDCTVSSHSK
jgi:hypothetical protein